MRVAFYTLGCKLNQAETESLTNRFGRDGFQLVSPDDGADIYVVNTCTVTHIADRKSRHWLRLARRRNPRALIIATGCYAQRNPQALAGLADVVVGNEEKERLPVLVQTLSLRDRGPCDIGSNQSHTADLRVRSLVKIQDGCRSHCTYCIVPEVRPQERSLPASLLVDEIQQKVAMGYKEVVLTGTKVGSYKSNGTDLGDLVRRILRSTAIERLRLSSLQPSEISSEFLALWQDERLCRHFHLALQSGSEVVLQRMRRGYSLDQYERALGLIREMIPQVAITTDVMVGFPGETDDEFERSCSFCQRAGFASIHVFPFSPRPGTPAASMPGQTGERVRADRNRRMLELSRASRHRFCEQLLGQTMPVLWEKQTGPGSGVYSGLTGNYIRVFARSKEPLSNKVAPFRLTRLHDKGLWGEVMSMPARRQASRHCCAFNRQTAASIARQKREPC